MHQVHSCSQDLVEFVEQFGKLFPEDLVRPAQAAALVEGGVGEIVRLDTEARGDMVADEVRPGPDPLQNLKGTP